MASSNLHLENSNVKSKINNHNIAGAEQHQKTLFAATHKCVRFHFDASWPTCSIKISSPAMDKNCANCVTKCWSQKRIKLKIC